MRERLKSADCLALVAMVALLALFLVLLPATPSWVGLGVVAAFAVGGFLLRGVTASGAVAGGIAAFILYSAGTWRMFAVLFGVFVLTLLATLAGKSRKSALGVAESSGGRSAAQVGANLFVAVAAIVALPGTLAFAVALAALCEVAADTVSSEIGEAFGGRTYLALDFTPAAPGTNGGVSLTGSLAGIAASAMVAGLGLLVVDARFAIAAGIAGVFGMAIDSLLGASLENDGYISNDLVNILGTTAAAAGAGLHCAA
jgi:uncharacterized protein (TIGR00297 family)